MRTRLVVLAADSRPAAAPACAHDAEDWVALSDHRVADAAKALPGILPDKK